MAKSGAAIVSIANGASLSGVVDLGDGAVAGIIMPAAWTAASLTFQVSRDGTTFYDLYSGATEYSVTGVADVYQALDPNIFRGVRYVKVRSGASAAAVAQGAARTAYLVGANR